MWYVGEFSSPACNAASALAYPTRPDDGAGNRCRSDRRSRFGCTGMLLAREDSLVEGRAEYVTAHPLAPRMEFPPSRGMAALLGVPLEEINQSFCGT